MTLTNYKFINRYKIIFLDYNFGYFWWYENVQKYEYNCSR